MLYFATMYTYIVVSLGKPLVIEIDPIFFNVVIRDITTAKDLTLLSAMCIRNTTLHSCIATNAQVYW
jgi:hypothetical protein